MVSSEEISRRLEARRRGVAPHSPKRPGPSGAGEKICASCQTSNPEKAKFCVGCGKPLPRDEPVKTPVAEETVEKASTVPAHEAPPTTTTSDDDYKICPSCGQRNKLQAKFCVICGNKFEDEVAATPESAETGTSTSTGELLEAPKTEGPPTPSPEEVEGDVVVEDIPEIAEETIPGATEEDKSPEIGAKVKSEETAKISEEETEIPEIKVPKHLKKSDEEEEDEVREEIDEPYETITTDKGSGFAYEPVDPVEKIKKAKELLDLGAITEEEFNRIKNKYLDQI